MVILVVKKLIISIMNYWMSTFLKLFYAWLNKRGKYITSDHSVSD